MGLDDTSCSVDYMSDDETTAQPESTPASLPPAALDLNLLKGLTLGPKWGTGETSQRNYGDQDEDSDRSNRGRSGGGGGGPQRRDRRGAVGKPRSFTEGPGAGRPGGDREGRPGGGFGGPGGGRPFGQPGGMRSGPPRGERRDAPAGPGGGERRGPPRGEGRGPWRGERGYDAPREYFQPTVEVHLYPEDEPFRKLTEYIKTSKRTFELFEIAREILVKPERYVVVIRPLGPPPAPGSPPSMWAAVPDGLPFDSEEQAIDHVFNRYLENFFTVETIEVEPPKGSYSQINRCGVTGELLGPPNYHKYQQILQQHHAARVGHMSFDRFLSRVEAVREPEVIAEWLQKMTKQTRFVVKNTPEGTEPLVFDNRESARFYLLTHSKAMLVRPALSARFSGKTVESLPSNSTIRRSIEFVLERQRTFPMETANHLRGRLRRLNFNVYKRGSKGVSLVCAIKRRFRTPGEKLSDHLQHLIDFIEHHPNIVRRELYAQYLGIVLPEPPPVAPPAAPVAEGETPPAPATPPPAQPQLSLEEVDRLKGLQSDLRWLVSEGYVTEYSDGRFYAPPPQEQPPPEEMEDPRGEALPPEGTESVEEQPAGESFVEEVLVGEQSGGEQPVGGETFEESSVEEPLPEEPPVEAIADQPAPVEEAPPGVPPAVPEKSESAKPVNEAELF